MRQLYDTCNTKQVSILVHSHRLQTNLTGLPSRSLEFVCIGLGVWMNHACLVVMGVLCYLIFA